MKKKLIFFAFIVAPIISIAAQSNQTLDRFLAQDKADTATTVWLIYLASGSLDYDATPEQAMTYLKNSSLGKRYAEAEGDNPIEFRQYAHIIMDELDLPGGLLYSLFKSPRYAAKELAYRRWMPGDPSPGSELTPWEVTTSLSQILSWKEEN